MNALLLFLVIAAVGLLVDICVAVHRLPTATALQVLNALNSNRRSQ